MKRREPNWDELGNIAGRAEAAQKAGRLDYDSWRSLVAEADAACNGYEQYSEFMSHYATSEWLKRLFSEPKQKRTHKPKRAA
jgi:YD repeat-containing protein